MYGYDGEIALLTAQDGVYSLDILPSDAADAAAQNELTQMENRVAVGQLLNLLSADEYQVVQLTFGEDEMTTREAADVLGWSQSAVSRAQRSALVRMRESLGITS